jgi:hypothetical protein
MNDGPRAPGARSVPASGPGDVRIEGDLDRKGAEALALEIRRLARRYGIDVTDLRIVTDGVPPETPP